MKFKILPGTFHSQNIFSSDIGWQGLLGCGNNNYVQIIDPKSGQLVQTLERHNHSVHMVKWAPENFYHDLKKTYSLKLASADISGVIVVWEATYATILSDFSYPSRKVLDFHWMRHQEVSIDFILVLHSGGELILWNTDSGNKVWQKTYSEAILDFTVDSHDFRNLAFRGDSFVLLVSDLSLTKPPEGNGRKFYICNAGENPPDAKASKSINKMVASKSAQLIKATTKLVMDFGGSNNEISKSSSNSNTTSCIQVLYHSYCQNHIIIVYPREILIMDLMIFQAVSSITLDRSTSNFLKVYSCWQNDLMFCLHENSVLTVRGRRPIVVTDDGEVFSSQRVDSIETNSTVDSLIANVRLTVSPNLTEEAVYGWVEAGHYQLLCQSEIPRLTRNIKVQGMSVSVSNETLVSIITSDTKIQTWELQVIPVSLEVYPPKNSYLLAPQNLVKLPESNLIRGNCWPQVLYSMIAPMVDFSVFLEAEKTEAVIGSYRVISRDEDTTHSLERGRLEKWGKLTMNMVSLYQGLLCDPTAMSANPVNMNQTEFPLVAIGNTKGVVQIWNVVTSQVDREFQVIHCPVRGIEWLQTATSCAARGNILVYGNSSTGTSTSSTRVKNSLCAVSLENGRVIDLRNDILENAIEMVRVSSMRQYFVVLLKEGSTEIWDCRLLTKIRDIPMVNRYITILEWSTGLNRNQSKTLNHDSYLKEKYLCIDSGNLMQHVIVEGNVIIKGRQVPTEIPVNKISAMAYKNNVVIIGDSDGNAMFWNFKNLKSVSVPVNLGKIHKISFDNVNSIQNKLIVMVCSEGVCTWDWKQYTMVKTIKWTKDPNSRIFGADWLDDGQALALFGNCEIRIVRASSLETCSSVISTEDFSEPIICLSLLPPKMSFAVKHYLQHQPWRDMYSVSEDLWKTENDIMKDAKLTKIFEQLCNCDFLDPFKHHSQSTAKDLAIRCYLTAVLIGDDYEFKFWIVVLKVFFSENDKTFLPWEILWPTEIYRCYQKSRLWSLERKRTSHKQTQKCAEAFIMLGDLDRAVRLLLETPPTHSAYVSDLQLACLLANQSNETNRTNNKLSSSNEVSESNINAHHSTVKLVATQFISNNCLKEGVQLLCAINKQSDACRYLETYHEWKTAIWLAKCTLSETEIIDMKKRWSLNHGQIHISSKCDSLLQLLALKEVNKVIELLVSAHQHQLAVRFVEFCLLLNISINPDTASRLKQTFKEFGDFLVSISSKDAGNFYFQESSRLWDNIGNEKPKEEDNSDNS